jgi:hypothetical protein
MDAFRLPTALPAIVDTNRDIFISPHINNQKPGSPYDETWKALQQLKPDELTSLTKLIETLQKQKKYDSEIGEQVSPPSKPFASTY